MGALSLAGIKRKTGQFLYLLKTGYWVDGERVIPDIPDENFENHFKVYRFVRQLAVGKDVLDVGCGTGYGTDHLAEVARSAVGVDLSRSAIRWARKRYPQGRYMEMDVQDLKFPNDSFDLLVSSENFEHLPEQAKHVGELARVLRPDGICFVASPNPWMFIGIDNPHHVKENSYDELRALFTPHFGEVAIVANSLNPPTPEGRDLQAQRWPSGKIGDPLPSGLDTTWLSNTHSYFCFLRSPIKSGHGKA